MNLNDGANALLQAIKATPEYAALKRAKGEIDKNPSVKARLAELNSKQIALLKEKLPAKETELRAMDLNTKYSDLYKTKEVSEFLKASQQFNDVISRAFKIINDSIEKDIKFL